MNQPSLYDDAASISIGMSPFNVPDTRKMARKKVDKKSLQIRLVKDLMTHEYGADEWAVEHGISFLNIRPRMSELKKKGLLMRTRYGLTVEGNKQEVYTLYPFFETRIRTLAAEFGLDAAISRVLEEVNA